MFCHGLQTNQLLRYLQPTVYEHASILFIYTPMEQPEFFFLESLLHKFLLEKIF